ncbi:hypothetical protein [Lacisediminimonas sp.]|uniref:hypothetical protein n=1 Tax=Lacisediminimonas sp. TaxID=3060582 RepID=UPI0027277D0D|nr:hypothetical protein [Lacisediminimonas sp.]MDO8298608.1 hypothetical protein [Lacisediminimonas sp.]MDO9216741.1 hypothetical protein [Lacisediminimonas sp.]
MPTDHLADAQQLRAEIAASAARMIAEDGADYASAKRRAIRQLLGQRRVNGDVLPDNAQIEDEVRAYNELFLSDTQPARLQKLRELALEVMTDLQVFSPYLTGAVLNGTAGEHSDIHLQLFTDSPKDVEMHLLNRRIDFEVSELPHFSGRGGTIERLSFLHRREGVHLAIYNVDDLRAGRRKPDGRTLERADINAVRQLAAGTPP